MGPLRELVSCLRGGKHLGELVEGEQRTFEKCGGNTERECVRYACESVGIVWSDVNDEGVVELVAQGGGGDWGKVVGGESGCWWRH